MPRCSTRMPAAGATSAQTSRERSARRQHSPRCWPVTVTKPKLRIEAPFAWRVAVDHHDPLATPRCRQGVGEPANAGSHHGEVEAAERCRHRLRQACERAR